MDMYSFTKAYPISTTNCILIAVSNVHVYCVDNIQKKKTFSFPSTTSNRTQIFVRLTTMILFDESLEKINTEFQIATT